MKYDFIIKQGFIVNGTGNPGFIGDVGIVGNEIVKVSSRIQGKADRVIKAEGMLVCPGFIDPHVHEELVVLDDGLFEVFLRQGVTSIINGNCGHSITPGTSAEIFEYMHKNGLISQKARDRYTKNVPNWHDFSSYTQVVLGKGTNVNMGFLLGHGTIRWQVMGEAKDRPPTLEEEKKINQIVEEGMKQGALGISTGLDYIPSRYADTEELIKVAKIVAAYDGVYASHLRNYIGYLEAVREAIKIGSESKTRIQISHLTPTVPQAFDEILEARKRGIEIAVDTIPKSTGHCTRKDRLLFFISALSSKLFDSGEKGVKIALKTKNGRQEIMKDKTLFNEDKDKTILINTGNPELENKTIGEIAQQRNYSVDETIFEFLSSNNDQLSFWLGGRTRKDFPDKVHPENIRNNPLVMVGSDTIMGEFDDPFCWYELQRRGAFPIFYEMYHNAGVRLEEIIRRITSLPAQQFRLDKRGLLLEGMIADISVINFEQYSYPSPEQVDYKKPLTMANGVQYVLVNGKLALEANKVKPVYSGEILYGKQRKKFY